MSLLLQPWRNMGLICQQKKLKVSNDYIGKSKKIDRKKPVVRTYGLVQELSKIGGCALIWDSGVGI